MNLKRINQVLLGAILISFILLLIVGFEDYIRPLFVPKDNKWKQEVKSSKRHQQKVKKKDSRPQKITFVEKSQEEKDAAQLADSGIMATYGLTFDYAYMTLPEVVIAYMDFQGIDHTNIAFSYKDLTTGKTYALNDTQAMTAGSTYKLPLNMLVVDKVAKGELSVTERFDITDTTYEYKPEHDSYVAAFNGAMSIPEMQEYSLVYSENTPAYALAERLGGLNKAYKKLGRYGESKANIKTIRREGNKTTTDYYIQVLDYLWHHQKKYKDILYYIDQSFPGQYYETYLSPDVQVYQKPGYVREALNIDAIVMEENPYMVALYTRYLGGSDENSEEINPYGYHQLTQVAYVINQWHRVNMNGLQVHS
ncbi:serine hydrolase [Streptococcus pluranimalium]|uniref:serine hydrolase n=1 Tax=Streptococcus pluranimalium TaxID=82348 RepID=UPI003F68CD1E